MQGEERPVDREEACNGVRAGGDLPSPRPKAGTCDDAQRDSAASLRHCHCLAGVWLLKVFCKGKCHKGWEE